MDGLGRSDLSEPDPQALQAADDAWAPTRLEPWAGEARAGGAGAEAAAMAGGSGSWRPSARAVPSRRWNAWALALWGGLLLAPMLFAVGAWTGRLPVAVAPFTPAALLAATPVPAAAAAQTDAGAVSAPASDPGAAVQASGTQAEAAGQVMEEGQTDAGRRAQAEARETVEPAVTPPTAPSDAGLPVLTVALVQPQAAAQTPVIAAAGSIAAWEEASVSVEQAVGRLTQVRVRAGDTVRRGQVLAQMDTTLAEADLVRLRAAVREAEVGQQSALAELQRVQAVQGSGVLSTQQEAQAQTAAALAESRLAAQRAALQAQEMRLQQSRVLAPVDGTVLRVGALVGAMPPPGQELFRLVRDGRLEWRAEVPSSALAQVAPGQAVRVALPGGQTLQGRVRRIGPQVDPVTRNGLVQVDLAAESALPGMYARGEIVLSPRTAWRVPASAVVLKGDQARVFVVDGAQRVRARPVQVGAREGGSVLLLAGVSAADRLVADGSGFLSDGDRVRVAP